LDICNSGDTNTYSDDLKALFEREKQKFAGILDQNQKEKDHKFDKYQIKKDTKDKSKEQIKEKE